MKSNENYVYVVLVKAHTGLGSIARAVTGYEYTHIAVCLEEPFSDFITFSRRRHYAPFDCGFMHETLECYAYGKHNRVKLKVFEVPTDDAGLARIKSYIADIEADPEYIFNLYSMATMPILHGFKIYKALNCMSFVARIIEMTGAVKLSRKYYRYSIKDMDRLLTGYLYKEEFFYKKSAQDGGYMKRVSPLINAGLFFRINSKLIYRMIFRRFCD